MNGPFLLPPPPPPGEGSSPVNGIPFVSLRVRNCRFRSHLGSSGLGSASSLECLDAPMVLLPNSRRVAKNFVHKGIARTVLRKEISLFIRKQTP